MITSKFRECVNGNEYAKRQAANLDHSRWSMTS
jgi:hypothetical protein